MEPAVMASVTSTMATGETNRLHRWAMWRMTVNEGIISCISENGTTRVLYPESITDSNSLAASDEQDFHEFPFITAEHMSLAKKLNLREKYGSSYGLSDDAYFIFGLPRINIEKDIPEVTSTGTRSVYESFSELGEAVNGLRGKEDGANFNLTNSERGPSPDNRSLGSHDDMEVQRINGYREEGWKRPASPAPRLNLYSIREEFYNNAPRPGRYSPTRNYQEDSRNIPNSYQEENRFKGYSVYPKQESEMINRYSPNRFPETEATNRKFSSPKQFLYNEGNATNQFMIRDHQARETLNRASPNQYQDESLPSVKETINRYETASRHASTSEPPFFTARQFSNRSTSSDRFNMNMRSPPQSPGQIIYPPFSASRQSSHSPTRRNYSPLPTSPRQNYSSLPALQNGYINSPTRVKGFSPLPMREQQSASQTSYINAPSHARGYSPPLVSSPQPASPTTYFNFPSVNKSPSPLPPSSPQQIGLPPKHRPRSPGYGNKMRPTRLMSDGEAEKMKRQAYYDWGTPTNDRYGLTEFGINSRYS